MTEERIHFKVNLLSDDYPIDPESRFGPLIIQNIPLVEPGKCYLVILPPEMPCLDRTARTIYKCVKKDEEESELLFCGFDADTEGLLPFAPRYAI